MHTLRLSHTQPCTERITTFCFEGKSLPDWSAGAHVTFLTQAGPRHYSLIRWPGDQSDAYHVAVQKEESGAGGSKAMHSLNVGDTIKTTAPKNDFVLVDQGKPILLLAGGIGITPMISMATQLLQDERPFALHYSGRSASSMAYREELAQAFGDKLTLHHDDETPLDLPALMAAHADHALYICGPQGMIAAARNAAEAAGIAAEHIHVELFTNTVVTTEDTAFEVEIASTGQVVTVAADQSIVQALEAAGIDVMSDCQRGDCGICQTKVLSGIPDHRDVVLSDAERAANDVMQICVSRARSERLVLDIATAKAPRRVTQPSAPQTSQADGIRALFQGHQVHRDVYISQDIYRLEMKHLFANTWVFVGHDSQTPNAGDYYTTQIGNQPVIMVRHSDDQIHVLLNRCPHKGTKIAIDRSGNTGKFFRCPYHAWSFKTDGCLLAIPLKKGYEETGFEDNPNVKGMTAVGAVKNYRGFIFARLNTDGISFEEYFGDSLSTLDNMVDRAPEGRLEVAGPPLRYMHQCNWKMLVENQTDTCHPMVAHESSAGTAVKIYEQMGNPEPRPPAMQIIAPFMSPYEFFEGMGIRTWPNGHGHTGVNMSIHSNYDAIPGYFDAMCQAYGEDRAKAILDDNRHNTIYFPAIMAKGPLQQIRNFIPLAANKTLVESWVYRLVGAPDQLVAMSSMYNRMINAPTSIVGHDDLEMYERAQEGLEADSSDWVNLQRLFEEDEDYSQEAVENGTTERQMRNQFDAWVKFMTADMETAQ